MKVKYRVKTYQDFQEVIHNNKSISNYSFVVYFKKNNLDYSRVGISTSKKLGNAVVRSRIRRQVRVMAKRILLMENKMDYVIIVRRNYHNNSYQTNEDMLLQLISKIKEDK